MLLFESFKSIKSICKKYEIRNYTINPDGTVDVDGNVYLAYQDLTEIPFKFGRVTGNFSCEGNYLSSLKGAPYWVGGDFNCYENKLKTFILEGGPKEVGGEFNCNSSNLTSLEGAPKKAGDFNCCLNELMTLEGCPKEVGGNFYCEYNRLTTLEGGPESVGGYFVCTKNKLITLEGGPKYVGGNFYCAKNQLKSLEGSPKYVGRDFRCVDNELTTLEGGPREVVGSFECHGNPIHSIYELFGDYKSYLDSLDYGYLRGTDIVKVRFQEALGEIGKELPESIEGYKYI